eukprot:748517-Hanusia_phi.AAC.1
MSPGTVRTSERGLSCWLVRCFAPVVFLCALSYVSRASRLEAIICGLVLKFYPLVVRRGASICLHSHGDEDLPKARAALTLASVSTCVRGKNFNTKPLKPDKRHRTTQLEFARMHPPGSLSSSDSGGSGAVGRARSELLAARCVVRCFAPVDTTGLAGLGSGWTRDRELMAKAGESNST